MDPNWVGAGAALLVASITAAGALISHGQHKRQNDQNAEDIKALEGRVTNLEKLPGAVEGLTRSIEHFGERMADSQKLYASELARLADQTAAGHKLMESQLAGFKELSDSRLSEMTENVRAIRATLDEQRSFAPAARATRVRGA